MAMAQAPRCLIGQPAAVNGSAILDLVNPLANELDAVGQLSSITFAIEDPIIREAFLQGKIKKPERFYKLDDVLNTSRQLNIPYVAWIEGQNSTLPNSSQKVITAHLTLYKGGKKVWEDTDSQAIVISNQSTLDDTIHSVMSSLNTKMQEGPLKGMAKSPKTNDPGVGKGQAPVVLETNDDDPVLNDWTAIQEKVKDCVAAGKTRQAEILLRDAIDAAPSDPARRMALIDLLKKDQATVDAAVEVTIAAAEALGNPSLISQAARILLDNDKVDRAAEIVKDAIAADPSNPSIQLLQGELQLRKALPDQALSHIEAALKAKPTPEGYYLRAVCRALLGSEEGVKLDLERAAKDNPQITLTMYQEMAAILDAAWEVEGPDVRSLLQKAELKPSSDEVAETLDAQERMAKACLALLGENSTSTKFDKSHGMRLLALNLLVQSVAELRHFIAKGDKDSLSDAKNDFTEMLKTMNEAKEAFGKERTDARNSNADH